MSFYFKVQMTLTSLLKTLEIRESKDEKGQDQPFPKVIPAHKGGLWVPLFQPMGWSILTWFPPTQLARLYQRKNSLVQVLGPPALTRMVKRSGSFY